MMFSLTLDRPCVVMDKAVISLLLAALGPQDGTELTTANSFVMPGTNQRKSVLFRPIVNNMLLWCYLQFV